MKVKCTSCDATYDLEQFWESFLCIICKTYIQNPTKLE